jgi:hypothetical protein
MKRAFIALLFFIASSSFIQAQWIHWGYTFGLDLYQRQTLPYNTADPFEGHGTGSALLNINIGPKFWVGGKDFSFSIEGHASYAPLAFDVSDYKGLGTISFPVIASLNFNGLSTIGKSFGTGFSIGGGFQYTNTELYLLSDEYNEVPEGDRIGYFPTYFGQIAFGGGGAGLSPYIYVRYGRGPDNATSLNVGLMVNINQTAINNLKKISPEN